MLRMRPYLYVKRILDFLFASFLLIILLPIIFITGIAIKIEDPKGPILFRQARPGKDSKIFKINKFRSMLILAEKNGERLSDEERLTKVGSFIRKTSIDELPQLLNILKGEMSFIGPRPLLIEYLPYYTKEEELRHTIRPGITGLAQINGRNNLDWDNRLRKDVEYVKEISLILDLKIFFKTILKVLIREDIAENTNVIEGNLAEIRSKKDEMGG